MSDNTFDSVTVTEEGTFFEKPRFWRHVKLALLYPFRIMRYRRLVRELRQQAERWRMLSTATVDLSPGNVKNIKKTEQETRLDSDKHDLN